MSRNAPNPEFGYFIQERPLCHFHDFMFDRIMCVVVRNKDRRHLEMSIIKFTNLISVHFWTYLINCSHTTLCASSTLHRSIKDPFEILIDHVS